MKIYFVYERAARRQLSTIRADVLLASVWRMSRVSPSHDSFWLVEIDWWCQTLKYSEWSHLIVFKIDFSHFIFSLSPLLACVRCSCDIWAMWHHKLFSVSLLLQSFFFVVVFIFVMIIYHDLMRQRAQHKFSSWSFERFQDFAFRFFFVVMKSIMAAEHWKMFINLFIKKTRSSAVW